MLPGKYFVPRGTDLLAIVAARDTEASPLRLHPIAGRVSLLRQGKAMLAAHLLIDNRIPGIERLELLDGDVIVFMERCVI